jgi:thiol-disulfide isomerase/thioredoxin
MSEDINHDRRRFLGSTAMTIAGARLGILGSVVEQAACAVRSQPIEAQLSSLSLATQWINSAPLTAAGLRGKVVLIDFGTYTCINWMRTLPYIRAWAEKYNDHGLAVIVIHTPEFPFEKNLDNVREALKAMNVNLPVAVDNDHEIWSAFDNQYWPALYFIDAKGRIRHHYFGEGEYEQSEKVIQQLLTEAGSANFSRELVTVDGQGAEAAADSGSLRSSENYLGYVRTAGFASPGGASIDQPRPYSFPAKLSLNEWALAGNWTIGPGAVLLNEANGRIAYGFHARDVNLVMGSSARGMSFRFRVLIDGDPPGAARGTDVDENGNGILSEQRMYQLIRQPKPIRDSRFDIEFVDPGAQAFSFTFG